MPETGENVPPQVEDRRARVRPEHNKNTNKLFEEIRAVHTKYRDNVQFRDDFYKYTKEAQDKYKEMLGPEYEGATVGTVEIGIIAEIEATKLADKEQQRLKAEQDSTIDPLTGAYNRRGLDTHLLEMQDAARRSGGNLSLVQLDLDHFKQINDSVGHDGGDVVLKGVVEFIKKQLRAGDIIARAGGEEFYIILAGTTPDNALAHLNEIREGLPTHLRGLLTAEQNTQLATHPLSASMGITEISPDSNLEEIKKQTDIALYKAKEDRNKIVRYAEVDESEATTAELSLEAIRQQEAIDAETKRREKLEEIGTPRWIEDSTQTSPPPVE